MKRNILVLIGIALYLFPGQGHSQVAVDVNMNVKHIVGGKSEFDRSKYIVLHAGLGDGEWPNRTMEDTFLVNYDAYLGRLNGKLPSIIKKVKEDPNKPGWPQIDDIITEGAQMRADYAAKTSIQKNESRNLLMIGGQEGNYPSGEPIATCCGITPWTVASNESAAEYYAHFIKEAYGSGGSTGEARPQYVEVINEPMVKAKTLNTTKEDISRFHAAVAKRVKELNPEVKVGGFTDAHVQFENGTPEFSLWNDNWKQFIDIAGADMDFYSMHIYDTHKKGTEITDYRAGSNIEALFDMIETYSKLKLNEVKPFIISEYGFYKPNFICTAYSRELDWLNLRSYSSMMMQFMEKPDLIAKAIPFMILKARWFTPPASNPDAIYMYRLLRQKNEVAGETGTDWVFTDFVKFFQLWSDVKGTRIDTKPYDLDIQVDAYVDGKKMYLILNNLELSAQNIDLNLVDTKNNTIEKIRMKHLHEVNKVGVLDEKELDINTTTINLGKEATMILEYTFSNDIVIDETLTETKIYANTYLKPISAGQTNSFKFKTSELSKNEYGEMVIRLGIGRNHPTVAEQFVYPKVSFNGTEIQVPKDWRGYNQNTRDRFFGVLEIPVPYDLIDMNRVENTVDISFSQSGGSISSVVLQKFDFSTDLKRKTDVSVKDIRDKKKINIYPNPASDTIELSGELPIGGKAYFYDISGKLVKETQLNGQNQTIDIANLKQGTYVLKVSGDRISNGLKFIKQ